MTQGKSSHLRNKRRGWEQVSTCISALRGWGCWLSGSQGQLAFPHPASHPGGHLWRKQFYLFCWRITGTLSGPATRLDIHTGEVRAETMLCMPQQNKKHESALSYSSTQGPECGESFLQPASTHVITGERKTFSKLSAPPSQRQTFKRPPPMKT